MGMVVGVALVFLAGQLDVAYTNIKKKLDSIHDYTCIINSYVRKGDKEEHRLYDYKFMRPGWVRMKIIKGEDKGAELLYSPRTGKVTGRKGGILSFIKLTFEPSHPRVTTIRGHMVNESHFIAIWERWKAYRKLYKPILKETETEYILEVEGVNPEKYRGTYREILRIDRKSLLPLGFEQYSKDGVLIHKVVYSKIVVNPGLKLEDFKM